MKKLLFTLFASVLLVSATSARPKAARPMNDLQMLLAMHQNEMQAFFASAQGQPALPAFFCDVSFIGEKQVESFLRNVSTSAAPGQVYSQVSFTRFVSVGGDMRGVSFSLVNNGGNVTLVKSTNINGQMLKAVYELDAASRKLKTGTFDGKKAIKSSEYSI